MPADLEPGELLYLRCDHGPGEQDAKPPAPPAAKGRGRKLPPVEPRQVRAFAPAHVALGRIVGGDAPLLTSCHVSIWLTHEPCLQAAANDAPARSAPLQSACLDEVVVQLLADARRELQLAQPPLQQVRMLSQARLRESPLVSRLTAGVCSDHAAAQQPGPAAPEAAGAAGAAFSPHRAGRRGAMAGHGQASLGRVP